MSLETEVQEYFSSLSCLSKTFISLENDLQESYGAQWDSLSENEKEKIFDEVVIPQHIADLYPGRNTEKLPDVFPKLKVPCGEKIIVEDNGRTWVDEHSGPFSWANRSQQDLTLFGTDEEPQEKKPVRPPRRQRSPDKGNSLGKPLGNSLGNHQPEMTAQDEIFQKFGIQFGTDQDDDEEDLHEDSTGPLLPNPDPKVENSYDNTEMLPESEIDHMTSEMGHVSIQSDETDLFRKTYELPQLSTKLDVDLSTQNNLFTPKSEYNSVPLDPPEEHTVNYDTSLASTDIKCELNDQVVDVQPISIPYPEFLEADEKEKDDVASEAKTGFDFLDNW